MGRPKGCNKDKRDSGRFITLPVCVLDSPAYLTASPHARMLLLDLAVQYRGNNNGDLAATWGAMRKRGWRSKDTLHRALQELLAHNLICEARKGSRPRKPTLYAVLWLSLDECGGKLDMSSVAYAKLRGTYQQFKTPAKLPTNFDGNGCKVLTPPTGPKSPAHRASRAENRDFCAPPAGLLYRYTRQYPAFRGCACPWHCDEQWGRCPAVSPDRDRYACCGVARYC